MIVCTYMQYKLSNNSHSKIRTPLCNYLHTQLPAFEKFRQTGSFILLVSALRSYTEALNSSRGALIPVHWTVPIIFPTFLSSYESFESKRFSLYSFGNSSDLSVIDKSLSEIFAEAFSSQICCSFSSMVLAHNSMLDDYNFWFRDITGYVLWLYF